MINDLLMKLFRCWWSGHVPTPPMPYREMHVRTDFLGHLKAWKTTYEVTECYFCGKLLSKKQICHRPKISVEMLDEES